MLTWIFRMMIAWYIHWLIHWIFYHVLFCLFIACCIESVCIELFQILVHHQNLKGKICLLFFYYYCTFKMKKQWMNGWNFSENKWQFFFSVETILFRVHENFIFSVHFFCCVSSGSIIIVYWFDSIFFSFLFCRYTIYLSIYPRCFFS